MNPAFFSIIIPTYNRAHLLGKAVDSVLAQTFADWELVIVDDGSTDHTQALALAYAAKDSRIKYVYQQNAERCAARNYGIHSSTGKYICFLDSDDYYLPDRLMLIHRYLTSQALPIGFFYTGLQTQTATGSTARIDFVQGQQSALDFIALHPIHSQQVCLSSEILQTYRFNPAFTIGEDTELWLRIAATYPPVYLPQQFTVVVLDHEDRSVNLKKNNSALVLLNTLRHMFSADHPGNKVSPAIQRRLWANCYFNIARHFIYRHQRAAAVYYLIRSVFADWHSAQLKFRINVLIKLVAFRSFVFLENFVS